MYVSTLLLCCFWHTPPYYNILENHVVAHSRWATNSLLFLPCKVGSNSPSLWIWAAFSDMFLLYIYIYFGAVCVRWKFFCCCRYFSWMIELIGKAISGLLLLFFFGLWEVFSLATQNTLIVMGLWCFSFWFGFQEFDQPCKYSNLLARRCV